MDQISFNSLPVSAEQKILFIASQQRVLLKEDTAHSKPLYFDAKGSLMCFCVCQNRTTNGQILRQPSFMHVILGKVDVKNNQKCVIRL